MAYVTGKARGSRQAQWAWAETSLSVLTLLSLACFPSPTFTLGHTPQGPGLRWPPATPGSCSIFLATPEKVSLSPPAASAGLVWGHVLVPGPLTVPGAETL